MASAGRRGEGAGSDCWVNVALGGDGIRLEVRSKVEALYGRALRRQVAADLACLGVVSARVEIDDQGALPFTVSARLEAAVRRCGLEPAEPVLPNSEGRSLPPPARDRLRRSRLYLPGNAPKLMINAGLHEPDGIILDLEDSVAPAEKDAARVLVRNALLSVDFMGAELMARINQLPAGLEDLAWVAPYGVQVILIPKCETGDQVRSVAQRVAELQPESPVFLMPIIESAIGCINAHEIASATETVCALTIGLEDYTADIVGVKTKEGRETFWARSMVIAAARAAGVLPIDSVYADVSDIDGLRNSATEARMLGFEGKGCIHPRQIPVVHDSFAPTPEEIEWARTAVAAADEAQRKGLSVVSLGSKMIDPPVVKRAKATLVRADAARRPRSE